MLGSVFSDCRLLWGLFLLKSPDDDGNVVSLVATTAVVAIRTDSQCAVNLISVFCVQFWYGK